MAAEPDGGDPPAAAIPEDLAQEVLLRIPPDDPLSLLRATLVCKPWIHAAAGAGFLRRLHEVHGAAPVLGFLHNSQICYLPRFVPTTASPFSLPAPDHRSWRALNYRHGRALFIAVDWEGPQDLLVWEPITGRRRRVPSPSTFWLHLANAAVLCAADGCDHRGCHGGPFRVAFTCINDESQRSACVYSSETETWGEPTTLDVPFDFKDPGVLLGTLLVYFPSAMGFVLEYDLAKNRLNLFKVPDMPEGSHRRRVVLMLTENGGLGAAIALGSCLYLWSREQEEDGGEARWVQSRVINLCNLIPIGVVEAPHESPEVMGFADGANTIFVETVAGLFTIDLHSEQARKVCEKNRCTSPLIPIVSFYTPGCKLQAPAGEREGKEEKTLERARAHELFDQGSKLIKEGDFLNAAECLSHALKKMIACYGRNVPECADTYFKYGCALLHKAQDSSWRKYVEGDSEKGDESDSNLNLALKLLHCARSIVEKGQANTMEKVKIFFALADVSLERDELDIMLDYYFKASAILENLVEPDHRRMVELYFRICFVLELRSMLEDAIPYCAKAMSVCNAHAQQLQNALEASLVDSDASVDEEGSEKSALEDEIELFTGIWAELKEKHVKLVQTVSSPSSVDDETVKRNLPRRRATGKLAMLCQELQVSLELRQQDDQPATVVWPSVRGEMTANKSQEIEMCPEPEWVSLWCASI